MKKNTSTSHKSSFLKAILLVFILSGWFGAKAEPVEPFKKANDAYISKNYPEAAAHYLSIYEQGKTSAALCYNLGNCYFKQNDIAKAILWYERGQRIAPTDEDIDFNLNVARLKITDKSERVPILFIAEWWSGFLHLFSADNWALVSILLFVLLLAMASIFLFSNGILIRKGSFYLSITLLSLFALSVVAAFNQRNALQNTNEAILMQPTCNVKSSPDENSTLLFVVHEGIKVSITDELGEWIEVQLENNTKGWIKRSDVEII